MKKALLVVLCLALQACALPRPLPPATDLKTEASEVIVIGKIELVPPINGEFEQRRYWNVFGEERMLNHVLMATGAKNRPVDASAFAGSDFRDSLEAEWGVPFIVKAPRQRTFLNGAVTYLDVREQDRLWFPGGYYFDVPEGARAVYIGTLRYHRNDFNRITKVEVVDERRDIAAALKTAGGAPLQVRPSLLKRVR
ncbi:hypothetical protein Tbd_1069 [Thiobacillus denitrificans ATCC 25259]|uniref:Lipoprotein n=1 Tax=Thiobacillus denitrificans (strain ATCC 25259 / T1) TaxID=292415 RepID=Q3SJX7_THIDA|nr:hypothetical protein [Thiobacillus denitrificans]AAZ97022.1 hypothetical protein Tbd_1069 [Thiobacillus denitrificans ATCC 25259]